MTSTFADAVTLLFIPMSIGLFFVMRPLSAALIAVLFADLYLPVGPSFKLPFVPALWKGNLAFLCILIACLLRCPGRFTRPPSSRWLAVLALATLVGGVITGRTNGDALTFANPVVSPIPGMILRDGLALGLLGVFPSILAAYLGYRLARDAGDAEKVLVFIAVAGLMYCPFALVEMRMSPQFHVWVYGYNVHSFAQTVRWGGWRPTVFTGHGLNLARFFTGSVFALFILAKTRRRLLGMRVQHLAWFHVVVFICCKSTGAIVYGALVIPFLLLAKPKKQLALAAVLAAATFLYPLLRATGAFPVGEILDAAGTLGDDRQQSMAYRYQMEDMLLEHARERIWFGWGSYGRNRVYDEEGWDLTVTDGDWIMILGSCGVFGFVIKFGLLLVPVFVAWRRLPDHGTSAEKTLLAGLALIVVITTVDMIPNALATALPYFLVGVLARRLRDVHKIPSVVAQAGDVPGVPLRSRHIPTMGR